MKTTTFLKATGLAIFIMLLSAFLSNAQIQLQGLAIDHEGCACWDADGTGPEPAATGHIHPFGYGSSLYYGASRDYDDIDPDPDAALCHFTDDIEGFPQFVQALADNGFTAGQLKMKSSLNKMNDDNEGEDWFTFNNKHHNNRYDAFYYIEINGEAMVSAYINLFFVSDESGIAAWNLQTNYSFPWDASESSSPAVKDVADAFMTDLNGQQVRLVFDIQSVEAFVGNGRFNGALFELTSGQLEKGIPELPFTGLTSNHEDIAVWNANANAPEPEAYGHTFVYGGQTHEAGYYLASRDYGGIDPDPNAAMCHFLDGNKGFPNLETQMAYRGFSPGQLKVKAGLSTLGDDEEGIDWGLDGSLYWYHYYGIPVSIEIAGEPILEFLIDTSYSKLDFDHPNEGWLCNTSYSPCIDISANASSDAQYIAKSFLKDIGGQSIGSYMEGQFSGSFNGNGRDGSFQQIDNGYFTLGHGYGTYVSAGDVSGIWEVSKSPYMITGDLVVPDGETLEIEPGVKVVFRGPYRIRVNGCVEALGEADKNIVFTHSNPTVRWDGFDFDITAASNDSSLFDNCIFEYGYAQRSQPLNCGGAIAVKYFDKLKITNCIFQHNIADQAGATYNPCGGAIALWHSDPLIQNCIFRYNYAEVFGGAIFAYRNSNPIISNCLFYGNKSAEYAGAIGFYRNSDGILLNNTIANNSAADGGALAMMLSASPEIINTILWDNMAINQGKQVYIYDGPSTPSFRYCDIQDGLAGFGGTAFTGIYSDNLEGNPGFEGTMGATPYALTEYSPCIDAGWPSDWFRIPCLDIECSQRICDGNNDGCCVIDMGAYEFNRPPGGLLTGNSDEAGTLSSNTKLGCYPNPFISNPIIQFELVNEGPVYVSVLDVYGKVITEIINRELPDGIIRLVWNTENIDNGLYFLRLKVGDEVYTRKIVKMR